MAHGAYAHGGSRNDFPNITSVQKELVTSFLLAGAAMGAIGAGQVARDTAKSLREAMTCGVVASG
jgi:hypothetical protein